MNEPKPKFDPDLSPAHPTNREAAQAHKVTYDPKRRMYVDDEGYLRFDEYGQPL
jgi:hypothetical protein